MYHACVRTRAYVCNNVLARCLETQQIHTALISFQAMEWAIQLNSANILTHLRTHCPAIPSELIERYPTVIGEYFFIEYPLQTVPKVTHLKLEDTESVELEEMELLEVSEAPLRIVDVRPTVSISHTFHLAWKDIGLTCFHSAFLSVERIPDVSLITHVDISHNRLSSVPAILFNLPRVEYLNFSHNLLTTLPGVEFWRATSRLKILVASHNCLSNEKLTPVLRRRRKDTGLNKSSPPPFRSLWYVDLSHNRLASFPEWLFRFSHLRWLDLQHNPEVSAASMHVCVFVFVFVCFVVFLCVCVCVCVCVCA